MSFVDQQQQQQEEEFHDARCELSHTDDEEEEVEECGEEVSVTAAEPIECDDDEDILDGDDYSGIPTIRLSSLGMALEKDVEMVREEYVKNKGGLSMSSSSSSSDNEEEVDNHNNNNNNATIDLERGRTNYLDKQGGKATRSNNGEFDIDPTSTTSTSEEMLEDHVLMSEEQQQQQQQQQQPRRPQRHRLVSEDGVIAEFDINGGHLSLSDSDNNNTNGSDRDRGDPAGAAEEEDSVKIIASAIEIDASFRSVNDLELGDLDPWPYPGSGSRGASSSYSHRARTAALDGEGASSESHHHHHQHDQSMTLGLSSRPELISATVIKNSPTEQVGLSLLLDDTVVHSISQEEDSLLRNCPFRPGDRVLSINNKRAQNMESADAARLLREATGFITIVVHHQGGDPCLIETMITKANKNQRSGMGLKSTGDRDLRVSSINENGLFAQSLLNVGDRILSINDVDVTEVDARVACDIIKTAADHVTVVARSRHTTGVVVAEVSSRGLNASEGVLTAIPESNADGNSNRNRNRNEIEAVDDSWYMNKRQREQLMMGLCILGLIVAIIVVIFGRGSGGVDDNIMYDDNTSTSITFAATNETTGTTNETTGSV